MKKAAGRNDGCSFAYGIPKQNNYPRRSSYCAICHCAVTIICRGFVFRCLAVVQELLRSQSVATELHQPNEVAQQLYMCISLIAIYLDHVLSLEKRLRKSLSIRSTPYRYPTEQNLSAKNSISFTSSPINS